MASVASMSALRRASCFSACLIVRCRKDVASSPSPQPGDGDLSRLRCLSSSLAPSASSLVRVRIGLVRIS